MPILFRLAIRNAFTHWRQSLGALFVIAASSAGVILFEGYIADVKKVYFQFHRFEQMLGDFIIENQGRAKPEGRADNWDNLLDISQQNRIQEFLSKRPDVQTSVRFLYFDGIIPSNSNQFLFWGMAHDIAQGKSTRGQSYEWNALFGKPLDEGATNQIHIAMGLARKLQCRFLTTAPRKLPAGTFPAEIRAFECPSSSIQLAATTEKISINSMDFLIQGIHDPGFSDLEEQHLVVPLPQAQKLLNTDKITFLTVTLQPGASARDFADAFNQSVDPGKHSLRMVPWQKHALGDFYVASVSFLQIFNVFVMSVLFLIAVFSVWNTVNKIVRERAREVGTLRSLGFIPRQVNTIFMIEMSTLTLFGLFFGLIGSTFMATALKSSPLEYKAGFLSQAVPFLIELQMSTVVWVWISFVILSATTCRMAVGKFTSGKIVRLFDQSVG